MLTQPLASWSLDVANRAFAPRANQRRAFWTSAKRRRQPLHHRESCLEPSFLKDEMTVKLRPCPIMHSQEGRWSISTFKKDHLVLKDRDPTRTQDSRSPDLEPGPSFPASGSRRLAVRKRCKLSGTVLHFPRGSHYNTITELGPRKGTAKKLGT